MPKYDYYVTNPADGTIDLSFTVKREAIKYAKQHAKRLNHLSIVDEHYYEDELTDRYWEVHPDGRITQH